MDILLFSAKVVPLHRFLSNTLACRRNADATV